MQFYIDYGMIFLEVTKMIETSILKVVRSISISKVLWEKSQEQAGRVSLSLIISRLLEMWLAGEVKITIEPKG